MSAPMLNSDANRGLSVLFRADGDERVGTGHVMRSIALAEACRDDGGDAIFAIAVGSPALIDRVRATGFEVVRVAADPGSRRDALRTLAIAREADISWVAADGYRF